MRNIFLLILVYITSSCTDNLAQTSEVDKQDATTLVLLSEINRPNDHIEFNFPATVSPVKTVNVSFEVAGRLTKLNLNEGAVIKQGELLAAIDPTPFQQQLDESRLQLKKAEKDLHRIKKMLTQGLLPESEFDNAQTNYDLAKVSLERSERNLKYTHIYAPFDAQVSRRLVDNNNYVKVGQAIATLQDVSEIHFTFHVPERLVTANLNHDKESIIAYAEILGLKHEPYELRYIEHSTEPDAVTQTYELVYAMQPVSHAQKVMPGARAMVNVSVNYHIDESTFIVPIGALLNESESFYLWVYIQNANKVKKVPVQTINIINDQALVMGDLKLGDKVVSAGVKKMRDDIHITEFSAEF